MKISHTILILILIALKVEIVQAQEKLSVFRNKYSITYKFGLPDGKETKEMARNSNMIQLERSFALNKLLSISPVVSYSHFRRTTLMKANVVNIGGNISVYPKHLASLIMRDDYEAKNDKMYFNVGLQKTINKADHTLVFNADLNIFNIKMGNNSTLSPNIGFQQFISSDKAIKDLGFYTVGLNFRFK